MSMEIKRAFIADEYVKGHRVKDIVAETSMNLASYTAATSHLQWASFMELHFAAKSLGIAFVY